MARKKRGLLRKIVLAASLALVVAAGLLGWNWMNGLVLQDVRVSGSVEAEASEVIAVARMDTGTALFAIEPAMIADRVQRHPWVRSADVTRLPPGTLLIDIEERRPVLLLIDREGIPSSYLDANGYVMPVTDHSSFDLPLIAGVRVPTNPNEPVANRAVRELAQAVAGIRPEMDRLVSSFVVEADGQIALRSVPVNDHGSIAVRLGRRDFAEKMTRLHAFWEQAVLTRPDRRYELIDLRFDSQIVTRESSESTES